MPTASPGEPSGSRGSVIILGADALLAALPATPTQLANACFAAGFDEVVPASWGDELLAVGCLDQLAAHDDGPCVACICPLVREQLRGASGLNDATVRLVSPPVAAALYIRATAPGQPPRITYVGDCPGAGHPSIDVHLSPAEFQTLLAERGIVPRSQRPVNGERAAWDRRRHYSLPGGVPAPQWLGSEGIGRTLVDLGDFAALSEESSRSLVDLAPRLGCVCSGALAGCAAAEARSAVMALEPPRSSEEVVNHAVIISIADESPVRTVPNGGDVPWQDFVAALSGVWSGGAPAPAAEPRVAATSRPPASRPRPPKRLGGEGSLLPRAYQTPQPYRGVSGRVRARAARRAERAAARAPAAPPPERPIAADVAADAPAAARRAPVPPRTTGVRLTKMALAATDRWLLLGSALGASVVVAVLTSVLTVHGLRGIGASTAAIVPVRETVYVANATPPRATPAPATPVSTVASSPPRDTTHERVDAGASRVDSDRRESPREIRLADNESPPARVHADAPARPRERHRPEVADKPPAKKPVRPSTSPPSIAAPPVAAPAAVTPSIEPPSRPAAPAVAPAPPAAHPNTPAPDSTAQSNAEVLQELRAIRNEIEARKRHVDSLTHALDSLGKP